MKTELLLELKNLLLNLPEKCIFNMEHFVQNLPENNSQDLAYPTGAISRITKLASCGTAACAIGWGILLLPNFAKELHLENEHVENNYCRDAEADCIAKFLGLSWDQIEYLFYTCTPEECADKANEDVDEYDFTLEESCDTITPEVVAARIQAVIDNPNAKTSTLPSYLDIMDNS